jgi:hypothetical protein
MSIFKSAAPRWTNHATHITFGRYQKNPRHDPKAVPTRSERTNQVELEAVQFLLGHSLVLVLV